MNCPQCGSNNILAGGVWSTALSKSLPSYTCRDCKHEWGTLHLSYLSRNSSVDIRESFNSLVDVINAQSDRLAGIEAELSLYREKMTSDARQAHKRDKRVAKPQ